MNPPANEPNYDQLSHVMSQAIIVIFDRMMNAPDFPEVGNNISKEQFMKTLLETPQYDKVSIDDAVVLFDFLVELFKNRDNLTDEFIDNYIEKALKCIDERFADPAYRTHLQIVVPNALKKFKKDYTENGTSKYTSKSFMEIWKEIHA